MQLDGGAPGATLQSEINVTPLVDVVLVLLIIFMVVIPLLMQGYDVDVPRISAEGAAPPLEDEQVVLTVGPAACAMLEPPPERGLPAGCRVSLGEEEILAADLPARLKETLGGRPRERRVLFVAADDRLNYEGVLRLVDLAKSGVDGLAIAVITAE
jgi:biopolymer transport protein ExbD